jgi:hypothetical protein
VLGRLERHILCVLLQLAAVYAPWLRDVLRTVPLTAPDWGVIAVAALTPVAVVDVVKLAQRWRTGPGGGGGASMICAWASVR